jgi:outer membrane protein assembly factor BamB
MPLLVVLCLLLPVLAPAGDWPRYRGSNGSGISTEGGLPADIGPEKNLKWKVAVPKGNSSPISVGDRIYITAEDGEERILLAFDVASGRQIWRRAVRKARTEATNPKNGNATPTPTSDGRSVFVFFPEVGLLAFNPQGKELWRVPLGPFKAIQGMAVSPVYAEGKVLLLVDTPEKAAMTAYDARSGKQVWTAERTVGFMGSYATPSIHVHNGRTEVIVAGSLELTSYDVSTGRKAWWARGVTYTPAALPLIAGDSVYTLEPGSSPVGTFAQTAAMYDKNKNGTIELAEVSGEDPQTGMMHRIFASLDKHVGNNDGVITDEEYNRAYNPEPAPGGLVRTRLGGSGDVTDSHVVWRYRKGMPYVTAPLLYEGVLYVIRAGGILATFDPNSGTLLHEARLKDAIGDYYASPVAGDGKIYLVSEQGKITVVKPGAKWEVLTSSDLAEDVIATPAIANGDIYIRTASHLFSFGDARSVAARP